MELTGKSFSSKRGRRGNNKMSFCIVNTLENGKRIKLSSSLVEALGNPETVQMNALENNLKIGKSLKNCSVDFKLSRQDTIYSSGLVEEITDFFKLDFSDRTSMSFDEVKIKTRHVGDEEIPYVVIRVGNEAE